VCHVVDFDVFLGRVIAVDLIEVLCFTVWVFLAIVIHLWVSNVFVAVPTVQKMFPRSVVLKRFGPGTRISF